MCSTAFSIRERAAAHGSGLGLAIVKQTAEARGGFATAANAPGGGALVRVSFGPLVQDGGPVSDEREAAQVLS